MKFMDYDIEGQPPLEQRGRTPFAGSISPAHEKLVPVKEAAEALGIPTWKVSRAAKLGVFPSYSLLNSRRLVKLSEVIAAIQASRLGGGI